MNKLIIAIIGGFVFALALIIIDALKIQFSTVSLFWFALILFGIVMVFVLIQFFVEKKANYYQKQL